MTLIRRQRNDVRQVEAMISRSDLVLASSVPAARTAAVKTRMLDHVR